MPSPNSRFLSLHNTLNNTLALDFCILDDKSISRARLLADAVTLSEQLPNKHYAINLCQDRYLFIVAYLAVCIRQQISLLPQNQASNTLQKLSDAYPNSYTLSDDKLADFHLHKDLLSPASTQDFPEIDIDRPLSISFTSGSTGTPKAISKTWREFQYSAELALQQFKLNDKVITLVSTAPMQHMFGLETCLFWVLFSKLILHNSRPFYPEDIRLTLNSLSKQKLLFSTPRHLKACSQQDTQWPELHFILSSTAPMSRALAQHIECHLQAPVFELFGSTETLSFASRQATHSDYWQPYAGIKLNPKDTGFSLSGGHIFTELSLDDQFEISPDGSFKLLGRASDVLKIAGKRASLNELNHHLNQIEGVDDGVFFASKNERLSAIVVSSLSKQHIINALKANIDEVFLPRSLYTVPSLPRNTLGKLIKLELEQLIQTQQNARK